MEIYLIHLVFIGACVYFCYTAGYRKGREEMMDDLMEYRLFTLKQLKDKIGLK